MNFNKLIISLIGFIFGMFLTEYFIKELYNDVKDRDEIMEQFYKIAHIGFKFRFIVFIFLGPLITLSLILLLF
ncbi:hypothetical protein [Staphylococcus sp. Marseille-Q6910]|uniref:hypothetical protein n=1 Tax=Staphylococcus sp. Marseille-Q6910 TaxID=2937990 RepID=UPI00203A9C4E|nr:hypothetical protein [Staphylococcus sp. Marseille-Q6910]